MRYLITILLLVLPVVTLAEKDTTYADSTKKQVRTGVGFSSGVAAGPEHVGAVVQLHGDLMITHWFGIDSDLGVSGFPYEYQEQRAIGPPELKEGTEYVLHSLVGPTFAFGKLSHAKFSYQVGTGIGFETTDFDLAHKIALAGHFNIHKDFNFYTEGAFVYWNQYPTFQFGIGLTF